MLDLPLKLWRDEGQDIAEYADNFRSPEIYADPWYGSVCL
jgi:hypothetical protein